jgi:hypothetical protein
VKEAIELLAMFFNMLIKKQGNIISSNETSCVGKKLEPSYLFRAEDKIATDKGNLQIYGGQMKYYPKTKSFNVWSVLDPANIDKRRTQIGLEPIAGFLKNRFNFEWNLEEQIKRSEKFEKKVIVKINNEMPTMSKRH